MFSPIQIKHECTGVEDVNVSNVSNRVNTSDNSAYPIFINQDVEYRRQLSQFWEQALSDEMPEKREVNDQQTAFQVEVNI